MKTAMTEMLGIRHPIQCGTMMWISRPPLVAAVAEAGGLACLASAIFADPQKLTQAINETKALTGKKFGVNVSLFPALDRRPPEEMIHAVIDSGVKIIETAGRNPEPYRPMIKEAGLTHIHKCARVRDAVKAEKLGVDLVSVVGIECGGHPSMEKVTSLVLIPKAVDAVDIPVIAGGGFCDGRSLVAALALGAVGVNLGTRFLVTKESLIHHTFKQRIIESSEADTRLVMESIKNPVRVMNNSWSRKVLEMEHQGASLEDLAPLITGKLSQTGWVDGTCEKGLYPAGQVIGRITDVLSVKGLIAQIMDQAAEISTKLGELG